MGVVIQQNLVVTVQFFVLTVEVVVGMQSHIQLHTLTHTSTCVTGENWISSTDCTNIHSLVLILYCHCARCLHWRRTEEMCMGLPCIFLCNLLGVYDYLERKVNKRLGWVEKRVIGSFEKGGVFCIQHKRQSNRTWGQLIEGYKLDTFKFKTGGFIWFDSQMGATGKVWDKYWCGWKIILRKFGFCCCI